MKTDKIIGLVGTGIFLCLTLQGISFLGSKILEEILLYTNLNPVLTYGLSEYATLIFVLIVFIYVIRKIKKLDFEQPQLIKRVFLTSVIAYVLTQVLGFALPLISKLYQTAEYFELKEIYYNGLKEHFALKNFAIEIPVWILKYLIITVIILKEIKLFTTKPKH
jgi:lysylphosphatidylglycerol synthetase-like protein (DUF2156 family)